MKHLKVYENFSPDNILDELNDIFDELRDDNLEVEVNRGSRKTVKDSITVGMHTKLSGESVVDFSQPSIKLGDISDVIKRANDYLSSNSYEMSDMFCIKLEVNGARVDNRDSSDWVSIDKIDDYSESSYSHISMNWNIPFSSFEEMRSNIRK